MQLIPGAMGNRVWDALSDAVIDWKIDDNGSVYVTSLDFPFWFDVLGGDEGLYFYTYCSVREGGGGEADHKFGFSAGRLEVGF